LAWLGFFFLAVNGVLLSLYFDSDRHLGGQALLLFNLPVLALLLIGYLIIKGTSDR
jgi:hypothetical protein